MDRDTRALTGIRGYAALWVVAHHLFCNGSWTPLRNFFAKGYLAVDLFFVLSGFVLALNHGAPFAAGASGEASLAFYCRRAERVYPLLASAVLLALALNVASGEPLPTAAILLANLTMTQVWVSLDSVVAASWSLSVEAFAYLAFPAIAAFAFRRSPVALACAVIAAWSGLWYMAATGVAAKWTDGPYGPLDVSSGTVFPILRGLCGFVAGVCAYRLACLPRVRAVLSMRGLAEGLLTAVVVTTMFTDLDVAVAALFVPLVCTLSVPTHIASRALRAKISMRLGNLSYAVYLAHSVVAIPVAAALAGRVSTTIALVVALTASLAAAVGLHELIERPTRAFLRDRRSRAAAAVALV